MAYAFNGSSQYLVAQPAAATGLPMTLACWFNPTNVTSNGALLAVSNNVNAGVCMLNAAGAVVNDPFRATYSTNAGNATADTAQAFLAGVWSHGAGVFTATQVSAWLNAQKTSVNASANFPSPTRTTVGARFNAGVVQGFTNGKIAECGIWNVALADDEIASLAKGVSPRLIRPQSLVFYAPLIRDLVDGRGGLTLTNIGSATVADHPRIYC